jgi:hypothetical protein
MDLELLIYIVKRGTGASRMFELSAQSMIQNGTVRLETVEGLEDVRNRLQSGLEKAKMIHQSMPMAAAALEQLNFEHI